MPHFEKKQLIISYKNKKLQVYDMSSSQKQEEGENYLYCSIKTTILNVRMDVTKEQKRDTGEQFLILVCRHLMAVSEMK